MTGQKIYPALAAVMNEIAAIPKAKQAKIKTNSGADFSFSFRGIDDIMKALAPALREHKVIGPIPRVAERHYSGNRVMHVFEFSWVSAEDGSTVTGSTIGEATDTSDKASNKAMSIAAKYFIILSLGIPVEEGVLAEQETEAVQPSKASPTEVDNALLLMLGQAIPSDVVLKMQGAKTKAELRAYLSNAEVREYLIGKSVLPQALEYAKEISKSLPE